MNMYCTTCGARAEVCQCAPGIRHLAPMPQQQRSVVGTTMLVLLTIFVIVPVLLIGGCNALASAATGDWNILGALGLLAVVGVAIWGGSAIVRRINR